MSKLEILKLKLEIYQEVYDAIVLDPYYLALAMSNLRSQIEVLEE